MNKIKKVFGSGSSKEDEANKGAYGASTNVPAPTDSKPADAPQLQTDTDAGKKSHGIFRQILNPNGDKYSEQSYGRTASTSEGSGAPGSLQTNPDAGKDSHGVLRQVLNPNGEKYSEQSHGTTATQVPPTGMEISRSTAPDDASVLSVKSGIEGPYVRGADMLPPGTEPSTSTTAAQDDSSAWRDATLAGIGAAGGGALASEGIQRENKADDVTGSTYTARSYPLSSDPERTADTTGMSTSQQPVAGVVPIDASHQAIQDPSKLDTVSRLGPHVPGEFPTEDGEDPHVPGAFPITPYEEADRGIGSGAAVATGAAAGAGTAGVVGATALGSEEQPSTTESTQSPPAESTSRSTPTTAIPPAAPVSMPVESEPESEHHYGRDAAIVGGGTAVAGAAGYGIFQTTKDDEVPAVPQEDPYEKQNAISEPTTANEPVPATSTTDYTQAEQQPTEDTNYTRDAAIVGGGGVAAGAAGHGIYEATKDDPNDTGPASKTIGPHKSNVANILDPRVKPEPEKMKENEPITDGPHKSDLANIADPRVRQEEPTRLQKSAPEDTDYGTEAAVAGGAGAAGVAGYGAYEANQDSEPSTPTRASRTSHDSPSSNNKTSVDSRGHHHLHKKRVEQQGEKKPGLMSKMFHPNRTKREKEEQDAARSSYEQQQSDEAGVWEPTSYPAADAVQTDPPSNSATAAPPAEEGYVTLHHEGADPDAPAAIVR